MKVTPRESVVFAVDFEAMKIWYQKALGLKISQSHEEDYHYCNLENEQGVRLGIADAKEMAVTPTDRRNNSVVLQFEVADVKGFFAYLQEKGGTITFGPSFDTKNKFWYGGFQDLEGNPFWVVDENCP